jgi:hypothetical protein
MRDSHVPLSDDTADRSRQRAAAITAYAEETAGTSHDLDPVLEAAGLDQLLRSER